MFIGDNGGHENAGQVNPQDLPSRQPEAMQES
jgi:hypothetical protein